MFGFRLSVPARGDDITADWARELVKAVRSLRLHAGPGIRLTRTPDGTTISAPAAPSAEAPRTDAAIHFGDAEDAKAQDSWSVADDKPAILKITDSTVKVLVDSRGNIISWRRNPDSSDPESEDPEDPESPSDPPPCGNPLNDTDGDDYNPLNDTDDDDYNPLNYEGEGGYTPTCFGDDSK